MVLYPAVSMCRRHNKDEEIKFTISNTVNDGNNAQVNYSVE